MNKFFRMTPAAFAVVTTSCLFAGMMSGPQAYAAESKSLDSCHEEVWRVSVTKGGSPKTTSMPRYQKRTVLVCDEKAFAEIQRQVATDSDNREGA